MAVAIRGAMVTGFPALAKLAGTALAMSLTVPICTTVGWASSAPALHKSREPWPVLHRPSCGARGLFRRGHRNVVFEVAHASGVFGVNLQRNARSSAD